MQGHLAPLLLRCRAILGLTRPAPKEGVAKRRRPQKGLAFESFQLQFASGKHGRARQAARIRATAEAGLESLLERSTSNGTSKGTRESTVAANIGRRTTYFLFVL